MMVLRTYRAQANPGKLPQYVAFERDEGVPMVAAMTGCRGVGFGRVREARDEVYVFASLWESQAALDAARASPTWKRVASKLEQLGFTLGKDVAEHVDLLTWTTPGAPASAKR